ncbi:hypothetical protein BOH78_2862, partial [Pichia kudriavzevii]
YNPRYSGKEFREPKSLVSPRAEHKPYKPKTYQLTANVTPSNNAFHCMKIN